MIHLPHKNNDTDEARAATAQAARAHGCAATAKTTMLQHDKKSPMSVPAMSGTAAAATGAASSAMGRAQALLARLRRSATLALGAVLFTVLGGLG
ncbi:MAG: hypothetical protein KA795_12140, partial [Burkholderiaceae bacterium]|nr:hypothetical protein [Burkholderiaceae bacterium]